MTILLHQFIVAVAYVLGSLLSMYKWILLISVLLTWVSPDPRNPIVRFLYSVTEPVLMQVRRRLPFVVAGGIDFSPIVVFLAIYFLQIFVVGSLYGLAGQIAGGRGLSLDY